jgi:ribosomal protein S18 acetylase RimI-like enzyme
VVAEDVSVREATEKDIPRILELWREVMEHHAALDEWYRTRPDAEEAYEKRLREQVSGDDARILVAESGGGLAGYVAGFLQERPPVYPDEALGAVGTIVVTESERRRGIATRLYRALACWLRERGATRVQLGAATANGAAVSFWKRMGLRAHAYSMSGPLPDERE